MKRTAKVLDDFSQGWLDEHKRERNCRDDHQVGKDFMSTMLSVLDQYEEIRSTYGSDKTNKATCLISSITTTKVGAGSLMIATRYNPKWNEGGDLGKVS
ncbi:hypothetical protein TIFTF001_009504 [Ficus carica]|uniref:Uncharacterized protein n=1 Tax=Ficus carica TaxID=3494 RepID=A0AA87ZUS6_FICCA|nr:hypothetical protein TIFTF001_009504 [Ficus carica]